MLAKPALYALFLISISQKKGSLMLPGAWHVKAVRGTARTAATNQPWRSRLLAH